MGHRGSRLLARFGALALVAALLHVGPAAASADPESSDAYDVGAPGVTVEVAGRIVTVQSEPRLDPISGAPLFDAHDDSGDAHGHGDAEQFHALELADGRLLHLDDGAGDLPSDANPEDVFTGELVVPEPVVEALEQSDALGEPLGEDATLDAGSAAAEAAVEALLAEAAPVVVAAGELQSGPAARALSGTTAHRLYVAVVGNRGALPGAAEIDGVVADVADYWQEQSNGRMSMVQQQTKSYTATAPDAANFCGLDGTAHTAVANEAAAQFPGVQFTANTANHLVIVVPKQCAGNYSGIGSVWKSFADGGWSISAAGPSESETNYFRRTVAHEVGHNLGYHHAIGEFCVTATSCVWREYGDLYSVMGYSVDQAGIPALGTPQREFQGIVDSGEVVDVQADTTLVLQPRAATDGVRGATITDSDGTVYYVEYRLATGRDASTYAPSYAGLNSYWPMSSYALYFASGVTVYPQDPDCQSIAQNCNLRSYLRAKYVSGTRMNGSWQAGETFESPAGSRMSVAVDSISGGVATVSFRSATEPNAIIGQTPTVSGTAQVGHALAANAGTWQPSPVALSYQWLRDGKAITGATRSSYRLAAADAGKRVSVRVAGSKPGFETISATSAATRTVVRGTIRSAKPKTSGTARVGKTLRAKAGSWSPKPSLRYQWLRNGKTIAGAKKSSYKLTSKDRGKRISVRVTGSKTGYTTVSKTSSQTKKVTKK